MRKETTETYIGPYYNTIIDRVLNRPVRKEKGQNFFNSFLTEMPII